MSTPFLAAYSHAWFTRNGGDVLAAARIIEWTGRTRVSAPANGSLQVTDNAGTGTGIVYLGPAGNANFIALSASGGDLLVTLATSGFADIKCARVLFGSLALARPAAGVFAATEGGVSAVELLESTSPGDPVGTGARLYVRDNTGTKELVAHWDDGSIDVLATK